MIEITHYYGVHQGGTKAYHLYVLASKQTGKAMLFRRWGKKDAENQAKIEMFVGDGQRELNKNLNERRTKGYDMRLMNTARSAESMFEALGVSGIPQRLQGQIYNSQVNDLDPSHNDGGKGFYNPLIAERDGMVSAMQEALAAQSQAEAAAEAEALKSNPIFGMF